MYREIFYFITLQVLEGVIVMSMRPVMAVASFSVVKQLSLSVGQQNEK